MSLRIAIPALFLVGTLTAACTGAPAEGEGIVTITTPTPPPVVTPPLSAGSIVSDPGALALMAATNLTFNLSPTGGKSPYTVTWNFGDGSAPFVGPVATHVFPNTGNFTVLANVVDAEGKTAISNTHDVRVRNVAGRWRITFGGAALLPENMDIVQNGAALVTNINETSDGLGSGTGAVSNPRQMSATLTFEKALPTPFSVTFVGSVSADLLTWTGTAVGYSACPCNFTAIRSQPPAEPLNGRPALGTTN